VTVPWAYPVPVANDDEDPRLFRRDPYLPRWALWVAGVILLGGVVLGQDLTAPWPRRGPGGGNGTNLWGPIATMAGTAALVLGFLFAVRAWYQRRR